MRKSTLIFKSILLLISLSIVFTGCKKDDDPETNANFPTVSLSNYEVNETPGTTVNSNISISAPQGLKKLIVLKNGTLYNEITYSYEKSASYNFSYTIENLTAGTVITFSFEAIDSLDIKSEQKQFSITVKEVENKEVIEVTSDIINNTTWTSDKIWRINNIIKVKNNTTLTIEPGTLIYGASDTKGTLLIEQGGKLIADGKSGSTPIVFTSDKAIGNRSAGDWGGIVICGKAPVNQGNLISLEGNYGAVYGGTYSNDNSGILRYVRIEFAGRILNNNQEINSLTLAGVGNETVIDYVQCSYGLDDSFEFFGGTVNAKHLISYKTIDDDFDFDLGHNGFIQFALAIRDAQLADPLYSNGLEIDNDGAGTSVTPITQTIMSNVTIIGGKYQANIESNTLLQCAAHIRRNAMPTIYNSFFTGFPIGIFIDDTRPGSSQHAMNNDLQIRNVILAGVQGWGETNWGDNSQNSNGPLRQIDNNVAPDFEINKWFNTSSFSNQILSKWQDAGIDESLYTSQNPKVTLNPGSVLLNSGKWDNAPKAAVSFFDKNGTNFIGAFGNDDWTSGWCNWDPQNK